MVSDCTAKKVFTSLVIQITVTDFLTFYFPRKTGKCTLNTPTLQVAGQCSTAFLGEKIGTEVLKVKKFHHILHIKNAIGVFSFLQNFLFPAKCSNSCHCNRLTCKNWCSIQNNQVSSKNTRWC